MNDVETIATSVASVASSGNRGTYGTFDDDRNNTHFHPRATCPSLRATCPSPPSVTSVTSQTSTVSPSSSASSSASSQEHSSMDPFLNIDRTTLTKFAAYQTGVSDGTLLGTILGCLLTLVCVIGASYATSS